MANFNFDPHGKEKAPGQETKPQSTFASFKKPDGSTQPSSFGQKPAFSSQSTFSASRPTSSPTFSSTASKPTFGTSSTSNLTTPPSKPAFGQTSQTSFGQNRPTFGSSTTQSTSFGQTRPTFGQSQNFSSSFGANRPSSPLHGISSGDLKITDEEFRLIRDFIYKQCGIFINESRKYLVENRLSTRIKELHLTSYNEYYKYLKFDVNKDEELNKLFVLVTTNETSFFRNPPQLKVFQDNVLTDLVEELRKQHQYRLRIWSAGCSTGEEPYTLAIIISEVLKNEVNGWDIKITANDLSTQVLQAARAGVYNEYSLRTTPKELVNKYFTKDGQLYKVKDNLKRMISFGQINLSNRDQLKRVERSHIVFCRNVIIYFDDDMKRKVINAFYDNLLEGGALLIGHSETLHNICRSFELEHRPGCIVYRKRV